MDELCFLPATELARRLRAKELSARELMRAHLAQIERENPRLNAIVTLDAEGALAAAQRADDALARGAQPGPLHGLPVAHKDTVLTRGMRTTFGSPILADFVPDVDALLVQRQRAAGAIAVGKTNVPEFAAGSQTFNPVFGATRNPYDLGKTCGGSSGGAAVALATGMVALADGSDLGGSLRNPANFCNVVGLRPSLGRVPQWPAENGWLPIAVSGPMGRTVGDVALLLSVLAGPDARDPFALDDDPRTFRDPLDLDVRGTRVAWSPTLGGLPVEPAVRVVLDAQRAVFDRLGCVLDAAEPDLSAADEVFFVLRALLFAGLRPLIAGHESLVKETVRWNVDAGLALTGAQVAAADVARTKVFAQMHAFFERYDVLAAPVNQVSPFPIDVPYPTEIDGVQMETYVDWMRSCSRITVTGHPAISVPAGFTAEGLPVGIQLIGRHRGEAALLRVAAAFEAATRVGERRPALAL
ncbi:MAG TPA: amidase [Candidatus Sulfotelmatobacter sp.]|nr:amidase [Candidatus Sulfotelmatobacter sp.]